MQEWYKYSRVLPYTFFLFIFLVSTSFVYSTTSIHPLSRGYADTLYCRLLGNCTLANLEVLGNTTLANVTTVNYNVTGTLYLNGTEINNLFIKNDTDDNYVYKGTFETSQNNFAWEVTDDGSNIELNFPDVGGNNYVGISTTGGFTQLYANPNPANDYLLYTITETQGADTEMNFYEGGTGHNRFWSSGSVRIGGNKGYLCSELTNDVDCDTSGTGADLVLQDDFWVGGNADIEGYLGIGTNPNTKRTINSYKDYNTDLPYGHFNYISNEYGGLDVYKNTVGDYTFVKVNGTIDVDFEFADSYTYGEYIIIQDKMNYLDTQQFVGTSGSAYGSVISNAFTGTVDTDVYYVQIGLSSVVTGNTGTVGDTTKQGVLSSVTGTADNSYGVRTSVSGATTNYGIHATSTTGTSFPAFFDGTGTVAIDGDDMLLSLGELQEFDITWTAGNSADFTIPTGQYNFVGGIVDVDGLSSEYADLGAGYQGFTCQTTGFYGGAEAMYCEETATSEYVLMLGGGYAFDTSSDEGVKHTNSGTGDSVELVSKTHTALFTGSEVEIVGNLDMDGTIFQGETGDNSQNRFIKQSVANGYVGEIEWIETEDLYQMSLLYNATDNDLCFTRNQNSASKEDIFCMDRETKETEFKGNVNMTENLTVNNYKVQQEAAFFVRSLDACSSAQTISSSTYTVVNATILCDVTVDTHDRWNNISSRFYANVDTDGVWMINGLVTYDSLTDQSKSLSIVYKNGQFEGLLSRGTVSGDNTVGFGGSLIIDMDSGDYLELRTWQNSGTKTLAPYKGYNYIGGYLIVPDHST